MTELRDFERRLIAVVRQMAGQVPSDLLADVESLVTYGEPVVVLENLCENIDDHDVKVPEAMARELAKTAAMKDP